MLLLTSTVDSTEVQNKPRANKKEMSLLLDCTEDYCMPDRTYTSDKLFGTVLLMTAAEIKKERGNQRRLQ